MIDASKKRRHPQNIAASRYNGNMNDTRNPTAINAIDTPFPPMKILTSNARYQLGLR